MTAQHNAVETPRREPTKVGAGEILARCRANAVRARQAGHEARYRCPVCADLGWVFETGRTDGGHSGVEVAKRCAGPSLTGCMFSKYRDEKKAERATAIRGRMDR